MRVLILSENMGLEVDLIRTCDHAFGLGIPRFLSSRDVNCSNRNLLGGIV